VRHWRRYTRQSTTGKYLTFHLTGLNTLSTSRVLAGMLESALHGMVNGHKKYLEVVLQVFVINDIVFVVIDIIESKHMNVHVCMGCVCQVEEGDSQEHCGT